MSECIHDPLCKLKIDADDERCSLTKLCKYYDNGELGSVDEKPKKFKKYRKCQAMVREASAGADEDGGPKVGKKEFMRAYGIVRKRLKDGQLDENQALAFKNIKGKHFKGLSEPQKQQLVDISETPIKDAKVKEEGKDE